eukprot:1161578-Pelagomonas_calceolata.AAC.9
MPAAAERVRRDCAYLCATHCSAVCAVRGCACVLAKHATCAVLRSCVLSCNVPSLKAAAANLVAGNKNYCALSS